MTDCIVRSRIDPHIKAEAIKLFEGMGLTISDAIRLFLYGERIVCAYCGGYCTEKALPATCTGSHADRRNDNFVSDTL